MINIVFFGTPEWAVYSIDKLYKDKNINIKAIVTKKDARTDRKGSLTPPPVKKWAVEKNIQNIVLQPDKIDEKFIEEIDKNVDFFVVVAYGKILPAELLDIPKSGTINIHPSLLPKYRGPSPLQGQILNDEKNTGYTIMLIDEEMDHGPILYQETVDINIGKQTAQTIGDILFKKSADKLAEIITDYNNKKITPKPQNHDQATYTKIIKKEDGKLHPDYDAFYIEKMIRAYTPWPSVYFQMGSENIKITEATPQKTNIENNIAPLNLYTKNKKLYLMCAKNTSLEIKTIQPPSKPLMKYSDFINGYKSYYKSL